MYAAPALETDEPVLLININKLFDRELSENEIYEATSKAWVIGSRRNKAKYPITTYRGITREFTLYRIGIKSAIAGASTVR